MTELELQLISTDDLTKEFFKRFDAIIIYGLQKNIRNNVSIYYDHYQGDQATLIGLCELLKDIIKKNFEDNTIEKEGEK